MRLPDYLPEGASLAEPMPEDALAPDLGDTDGPLGSVWVNWTDRETDRWWASWQRGEEHHEFDGSKAEAIAWALAHEASYRWIFDCEAGEFVELTP